MKKKLLRPLFIGVILSSQTLTFANNYKTLDLKANFELPTKVNETSGFIYNLVDDTLNGTESLTNEDIAMEASKLAAKDLEIKKQEDIILNQVKTDEIYKTYFKVRKSYHIKKIKNKIKKEEKQQRYIRPLVLTISTLAIAGSIHQGISAITDLSSRLVNTVNSK